MAELTGKLIGDFSSFVDACESAEFALKTFEDGAVKAESQLKRMTDSLTGVKIIQEATLIAEAVDRIGGVSQLTENELIRLGSTAQEAVAKMKALGMEVPAGLQQLADASKAASDANKEHSLSVGDLVKSYVSAQAIIGTVTAAWETLVGFLKDSVKAASDAEDAHQHLVAALNTQGTAIPSVIAAYEKYAAEIQRTTVYQDDAAESAMALLAQIGGVMPGDMELAIKATADLASALNVDLQSAAMMVAKAAEGQTTALKKAGIVLDETTAKSGNFRDILGAIEDKLHGTAEAMAGTLSGRLKQFSNEWNNVEEAIGGVIVKNESLRTLLASVNTALRDNSGALNENKDAQEGLSASLILMMQGIDVAVTAFDYLVTAYESARRGFDDFAANMATNTARVLEMFVIIGKATAGFNPIAWTDTFKKAMRETADAVTWLSGATKGFDADGKAAADTADLVSRNANKLHGFIEKTTAAMEAVKGKTVEVTNAMKDFVGPVDESAGATENLAAGAKATADAMRILRESQAEEDTATKNRYEQDIKRAQIQTTLTGNYQSQIATLFQLDAIEQQLAVNAQHAMNSDAEAAKIRESAETRHLELMKQVSDLEKKDAADRDAQVVAELQAFGRLQAAYGVDVNGKLLLTGASEDLRKKTEELNILRAKGYDVTYRQVEADNAFTDSVMKEAQELDRLNGIFVEAGGVIGHYADDLTKTRAGVDDLSKEFPPLTGFMAGFHGQLALGIATLEEYNKAISDFYDKVAEEGGGLGVMTGTGVGIPVITDTGRRHPGTSAPSRDSGGPGQAGQPYYIGTGAQPELFVPSTPGNFIPANKQGGGATVNNTFNIVDTEANIASRISDRIARSVLQATKMGGH